MEQIQKQLNFQNKMMSKFENEKKQMEIDHLKALLALKQGSSDVGSVNSLNKGSVRAREVGHTLQKYIVFLYFFFYQLKV